MLLTARHLGLADYQTVWDSMRGFTDTRTETTPDEIWFLEHPRVFTQGQAGKAEHVLAPGDIPVIQVDRGGQVTYHGPGQIVGYLLIDLRRRKLGIRELVTAIENALVAVLANYGIAAANKPDAPGVYLTDAALDGTSYGTGAGAKIASLGLRVRKGCTFHGLALNVDMDLEPFARINPCGYSGLQVTQMCEWAATPPLPQLETELLAALCAELDYDPASVRTETKLP